MNLSPENVCGNRQACPDSTDRLVRGITSGPLWLTKRHQQ